MPNPGEKISHYKVVSAIGKGGMGEVYLAEDTRLERQVALKILLEDVADDSDRVRRFVQEAKAASALNHPNILTVYEIGEYENSRYIATEFIQGETLRDRIRRDPIGLSEAIGIAQQTAASLAAAHEAGILHRDIKPENIMIRKDGLVKVLDFGLAKLTEQPARVPTSEDPTRIQLDTQPGMIVGTVAYMSPEQVRGRKLDARSDIFSLGIVMYELFSGRFPFEGEGHMELASAILKDEPPSLRELSPDLPRQLERIVDKALRKDRENRYQHVKDLQIDLEDLRDELKFESKKTKRADLPLPTNTTQRLTLSETISTTRRFTLLHAFLFTAVAAVLVGAAWYFSSRFVSSTRAPGSYKTTEVASWSSAPGEIYSSAKFSPDGNLIAFASTRSGSKNIWVTQANSTEARQITNDNSANIDPIWSPKGDEIAYFSIGANGVGIWRVPALGGTPKFIGSVIDQQSQIRRWTQSGKIYFQYKGDLYALDVSNGSSQKITSLDQGQISWIDVSSDEQSIAFATENNNSWRIAVSDIAGRQITEVATGTGKADGFAWLPEKKRIFYGAPLDGVLQVFVSNTGSGESRRLTASEVDIQPADAAPDGRAVVVTSAKEEAHIWRVGISDGQDAPVSRDINAKIWPDVSPANDKIAFQSVKSLNQGNQLFETAIAVKSIGSRDENERATVVAEHGFLPAWSPDGSTIAFLRQANMVNDLYAINPNGGSERKLASDISPGDISVSPYNYSHARAFAWSSDSSRIAYVSKRSGASNVWAVRPGDASDIMLTDNTDPATSFLSPIWSADGKRIAFSYHKSGSNGATRDGLEIVTSEPGSAIAVYETPRFIRLLGWTADETGLIFAEREGNRVLPPEALLKRVAIGGGKETVIASLKNTYFYNIFLSDDRKLIAYAARSDDKDDIWIIPSMGGTPRKLTANNDTGLYYSRLAWLHDGSAIVFGKQTRFSLLSMITDID